MKIILLSVLYFFAAIIAQAQCFDKNFSFRDGEIISYEAYYNWGFIWLNAGFVEFKVKDAKYADREVYHLDSYGASHKSYDWIFKVRDNYQSYLDKETLRPLLFYRKNYEGGFEVENKYSFDQDKKLVYSSIWNTDKPLKKDTLKLPSCTFDVLSVVYYCRNLDFSRFQIGDSIPIRTILDNEFFNLYVRYLGKEDIVTRDGLKYRCIKFSALLIEGTIFKGGEDLFVWVTDDKNRVPVLVEAKILIGSVKAYLAGMQGLRNPVESLVK